MANEKRPLGRDKNVTGGGHGVHRRGDGLGSGPVGSGSNPFGRAGSNPGFSGTGSTGGGNRGGNRGGGRRRGGGGLIAVLLLLLMGGGGGVLNGLLGDSGESYSEPSYSYSDSYQSSSGSQSSSSAGDIFGSAMDLFNTDGLYSYSGSGSSSGSSSSSQSSTPSLSDLLEGMMGSPYSSYSSPSVSSGWSTNANTGILNAKVAPEARDRYTVLRGNGKDTVTLLVYMCGADLESRSAMATRDLLEMTKADISDKVNVIVYTGGAKQWQNNIISSSVNQIYRVKNGGLSVLEKNAGTGAMTDPNTLAGFIQYGAKNFPADRYALILWDHGGGSLSGYGYDEKNARSGSMSLASLDKALSAGDLYYDFIGFDTCLMATVENAIMLTKYADYMIASEETEPGTGWYYTDWLTSLSRNTSIPTTTLGKQIIDDYINSCASSSRGQAATLSLVDLAELEGTLPKDFAAFSRELRESISTGDFMTVSSARSNSREFAASTRIDQVDFVDFAQRIGSESSKELVKVLLSAVKYNRTSSMTNAYGLSVYFPLRKMSSVDTAIQTYSALGLDSNFSGAIREFASMELSGQASSHGSYGTDPLESLFGSMYGGSSSSYSSSYSSDDITGLISGLLGSGDLSELLGGGSASFFTDRSTADIRKDAAYIANNRFDATALLWTENSDGLPSLSLSDKQWSLVRQVDVNLFYDDGEGFVDLGLDNSFTFDKNGALVPDVSGTWVSINEWPVAYYHDSTVVDGSHYTISGHVPAYLTGTRSFDDGSTVRFDKQRVDLELLFTDEQPHGYVAGARIVYDDSETDTVARGLIELADGDVLDFICDYYSYDGSYQDSYLLGDALTVDGELQISDTYLGEGGTMIVCRFTDIYGQDYWTQAITLK